MTPNSRPPVRLARAGSVATAGMLAFAMSGCSDAPDENAYCVNAQNEIVDEEVCEAYYDGNYDDSDDDHGGGGFFIIHSSSYASNLPTGHKLSGGTKFPYNDASKRAELGLPRSGKIGSGGSGAKISGSKVGGGGMFGGSGRGGGS